MKQRAFLQIRECADFDRKFEQMKIDFQKKEYVLVQAQIKTISKYRNSILKKYLK